MSIESKKAVAPPAPTDAETESAPRPARLVYTQAPVLLGRIVGREGELWSVDLGAIERVMSAEPCVDPALLEEALMDGSRVLIDASGEPVIVGVITTKRSIDVDREGHVNADVRSFQVTAMEQVLFKVPGAFVRAKDRAVEVYGDRVLTRARDLAKILAAMIKLN